MYFAGASKTVEDSFDTNFALSPHRIGRGEIDEWLSGDPPEIYSIARQWFEVFRIYGNDVNELLHDGYPTAGLSGAAFGYINVFKSHVKIGFFMGAFIDDPHSLLEGSGKRMCHVKLRPESDIDTEVISELIRRAYIDMKIRLSL
ncbi:MAG: DUF1801 domain-containing protein [Proteobacteria bacterium]|nr:DUF1801 domain-containing protein [Pseudomonadota bacterium]MDA1290241.1 DUF1801 domain-containing protein [Pseudomonadota bacterium]